VAGRIAGVGDLAGARRQRGDRAHRPAGDRKPGEGGEQGRAEHPGGDEQPESVDRRLDVAFVAPVLHEPRDPPGLAAPQGDGDHPQVADLVRAEHGRAEVDRVRAEVYQGAAGVEYPRHRVVRADEIAEVGLADDFRVGDRVGDLDLGGEGRDGPLHLPVEVVADAIGGEVADDCAEEDEDDQRQARRDGGQPPADGPVARAEAGGPGAHATA
jgi:hypothetical protein